MARVTIEDCIEKLPNRFELVMVAAQRARKIGSGASLTVERDNDKNPVIALREIADVSIPMDDIKEELVRSHQRIIAMDEDNDTIDLMDGEEEWSRIAAQANHTGIYADEAIGDEDEGDDEAEASADPSLEDLAGA